MKSNAGSIKSKGLTDTITTELQTMPQSSNNFKFNTNGDQNGFNQNSNGGIPRGLQCFLSDIVLDENNKPIQVGPQNSPYMNNNSNNVPFQNSGNYNFANTQLYQSGNNQMNQFNSYQNSNQKLASMPKNGNSQFMQNSSNGLVPVSKLENNQLFQPNHMPLNNNNVELQQFLATKEGINYLNELRNSNISLNTEIQFIRDKLTNIEKVLTYMVCEMQNLSVNNNKSKCGGVVNQRFDKKPYMRSITDKQNKEEKIRDIDLLS